MKFILILIGLIFSKITFAGSSLQNIQKATEIVKIMSQKCKNYRKQFDLEETKKRLSQDAKSFKGLKFKWDSGSSASMEYEGIRMVIMPSDCQAPGDLPVDSI